MLMRFWKYLKNKQDNNQDSGLLELDAALQGKWV
jgi:hypothetical protein